jgi:hypothetical protein
VQSPSLEINANDAGKINGSRKDHWHPSNTLQLKKSLSIAFWRTQGLTSLIGIYQKFRLSL